MRKNSTLLLLLVLIIPSMAQAGQFAIVGPRALGMGGASVAAVNDSTAVYWNPAALAQYHKFDIRIPVEAAIRDHMGVKDTWNRIDDIYYQAKVINDASAIAELIQLISDLDKPNTGADIDASTGMLISVPFPNSTIAVSALGLAYGGIYPTADTANLDSTPAGSPPFVGYNTTALTGVGLVAVEPAFSFALALGKNVFLGANAKMIYAQTFVHSESIGSNNFGNFISNLDASKTRSDAVSLDAGVIVAPSENLSIGLVGRDLTSPKFTTSGLYAIKQPANDVSLVSMSGEIELKPQVRAGVAWKPLQTLTLAADFDITKNETLTPGYEDQTLAVGLEKTFLAEYLSIRVGAYKNVADSEANTVYTAGFGTRIMVFRLDFAGAYDFDEREGQASMNLAVRF